MRNGHDWIEPVPAIAAAPSKLKVRSVTIDGECVVCRTDGLADFDALRSAISRQRATQAFLYAFDLLELKGSTFAMSRGKSAGRRCVASYVGQAQAFN